MYRSIKLYGILTMALALFATSLHAGEPIPPVDFTIPQGAYSAKWIEDREHISVMEFAGAYDKRLSDGSFNRAARATVAKEFFAHHPDNYDFLVVFSSFEYNTGDAVAFEFDVQNQTQGIGKPIFNHSALFGSKGKLRAMIDMAAASRYVLDPHDPEFEKVLMVLAHETLHHWASGVHFTNADGQRDGRLLGKDGAHWNFFLDTKASVEYGHKWKDNGDGTFSAVAARRFYSPLDLYLMGFYSKEQVQPFALLQPANTQYLPTDLPSPGAKVNAVAETVTIDQIIAQEGPRVPNAVDSQKEFRFGFIYLKGTDEDVDPLVLNGLKEVRAAFAQRFTLLTAGKGIAHIYPEAMPLADLGEADPLATDDTIRVDEVNVTDALQWLRSRQEGSGYWQDKASTRYRDSALAYRALKSLDTQFTGKTPWDNGVPPLADLDTDSLARFILAGLRQPDYIAELAGRQNVDGGWGLNRSLASAPYDTALALQALAALPGNSGAKQKAVQYLQATRKAAAGWPATAEGPSVVRITTEVLNALDASDVRDTNVDSALAWLKGQQRGDGGYGTDQSTIHETAQVLLTLAAYQELDDVESRNRALQYINDRQRTSGHWEGSVYTTALAVSALQQVNLPNLLVQSISVGDADVVDGERVKVRALVGNDSNSSATGTSLQFYLGDPASGGVVIGQPITLPVMPVHSSQAVDFYWDTLELAGNRTLFAKIDPNNSIIESSEGDNTASLAVTIKPAPAEADLEISASAIQISPTQPNFLPTDLSVTANVRNLGQTNAANVAVQLWRGEPESGVLVETQTVAVPSRNSAVLNFVAPLVAAGTTSFTVVADGTNAIAEADESNNQASQSVTPIDSMDLAIAVEDIVVGNSVFLHEDVMVNVTIRNRGTIDAPDTSIRFSMVNDAGSKELQTVSTAIQAGQSVTRQVLWKPELLGNSNFLVEIDPDQLLAEQNESNNNVSKTIAVTSVVGANLSTSYRDIRFTPSPALEGLGLTFEGLVKNNGTEALTGIRVALYDGAPASGGVEVGSGTTIARLEPGEVATATIFWNQIPTPGNRVMYLVVDPANTIAELNETDNVGFVDMPVRSLPDLAVSAASVTLNPAFPKQGQSAALKLQVTNRGNQPVDNVKVRILVDGAELSDSLSIASIASDSSANLDTSVTFADQGNHQIEVFVDSDNQIAESNETNNSALKTVGVQDGNFHVTERYLSPDGDGSHDSTEFSFRLEKPQSVKVSVLNRYNRVAYTFEERFENATSGKVTWDGKSSAGAVVGDGEYRIVLTGQNNEVLGQALVTIDTNRSPLFEAIGTEFSLNRNLTCQVGQVSELDRTYPDIVYSPDDETIAFATAFEPVMIDGVLHTTDENTLYPSGLYRALNDGTGVSMLIPHGYRDASGKVFNTYGKGWWSGIYNSIGEILFSPNGSRVAVLSGKDLWSVNIDGSDIRYHSTLSSYSTPHKISFDSIGESLLFLNIHNNWEGDFGVGFDRINLANNTTTTIDFTDAVQSEIEQYGYKFLWALPIVEYNQQRTHALITFQYDLADFYSFDEIIREGVSVVYLVNLQTGDYQRIATKAHAVAWAPNGARFALGDAVDGFTVRDLQGNVVQTIALPEQNRSAEEVESYLEGIEVSNQAFYGQVTNIAWNPDQTELSFVLEDYLYSYWYNKHKDEEISEPVPVADISGIYLADLATSEVSRVANVAALEISTTPMPESYHFLIWDGKEWVKRGELHFGPYYHAQKLDLSHYLPDASGQYRVRIKQTGQEEAHIDAVSLNVDAEIAKLTTATIIGTSNTALDEVRSKDNIVADVHGKTIELTWETKSKQGNASIELVAREATPSKMRLTSLAYPAKGNKYYEYKLGSAPAGEVAKSALPLSQRYGAALFTSMSHPESGHPSAPVSAHVTNDKENLYVALDFGVDNTESGANDWAQLEVLIGNEWKSFRITQTQKTYGEFEFKPSDLVRWPHKIYHFKLKLSELSLKPDVITQLRFKAYGSAGVADLGLDTNEYGFPITEEGLPYVNWSGYNFNHYSSDYKRKLFWLNGSRSLLLTGSNTGKVPVLLDLNSPKDATQAIFQERDIIGQDNSVNPSSTGRLLTYYSSDYFDECARNGSPYGYRQFQSLLNLSLDLKAVRSKRAGGIILRGTASDQNFSQYQLEYAEKDNPDQWNTIVPPSNTLTIDKTFAVWGPPEYGTYFVRLTAWDLAGNTRSTITRVTNNDQQSISNVYRQPDFISPNGDGIQDAVSLNFKVLRPVNLEMNVYDASGVLVRTYARSFSMINADETFSWDGRDEKGALVSDGTYKLVILDYEFDVTVDKTAPKIVDATKPLWLPSIESKLKESNGILNSAYQFAVSDNLSSAQVSLYQKPVGASDWTETSTGTKAGALTPTLAQLVTDDYQIRATDKAGNVASYTFPTTSKRNKAYVEGFGESSIGFFDELGSLGIHISPIKFTPYNVSTIILDGAENIHLQGIETLGNQVLSVEILVQELDASLIPVSNEYLSYQPTKFYGDIQRCPGAYGTYICGAGSDGDSVDAMSDHNFNLSWDYAKTEGFDWAKGPWKLQLRLTTAEGSVVTPNYLILMPNGIRHDLLPPEKNKMRGFIKNVPLQKIESLILKVQSSDDPRYSSMKILDTVQLSDITSDTNTDHGFEFDIGELKPCLNYKVTYFYTLSNGQVLTGEKPTNFDCINLYTRIKGNIQDTCDGPATDKVTVELYANSKVKSLQPLLLTLGIPSESGEIDDVLFNVNEPAFGGRYSYDIDTSAYPEGALKLAAEFTTVEGYSRKELFSIPVTKSSVTPKILAPLPGQKICARQIEYVPSGDPKPRRASSVIPDGVVDSVNGLAYKLSLATESEGLDRSAAQEFACNSVPTGDLGWDEISAFKLQDPPPPVSGQPLIDCRSNLIASAKELISNSDVRVDSGFFNPSNNRSRIQGTLGIADINYTGKARLFVDAYNWSGAHVCQQIDFEIDAKADADYSELRGGSFKNSVQYFSPNSDGEFDLFSFEFTNNEPLTATLSVFDTVENQLNGYLAREKSQLRTVVTENAPMDEGSNSIEWDGKDGIGNVVPDGHYIAELALVDGCGNETLFVFRFIIDNTPPQLAISYPLENDPIGVELSVFGSAADNFGADYQLLRKGADDSSAALLHTAAVGNRPDTTVINGPLMPRSVNTFGLEGTEQTFTLTARDWAGNQAEYSTTITVPDRTVLISSLEAAEELFSPNADGRMDTIAIRAKFEQDISAEIIIENENGTIAHVLSSGNHAPGYFTVNWDGKLQSGNEAPDGKYKVKVNATLLSQTEVTQSEQTHPFALDTVAPKFNLDQMTGGALELKGQTSIAGNIEELHFKRYSVSMGIEPDSSQLAVINQSEELPLTRTLATFSDEASQQEGIYQFKLFAEDLAQNRTEILLTGLVDPNAPKIDWISPDANELFGAADVSKGINIEASVVEPYVKNFTVTLLDMSGAVVATIATGDVIEEEQLALPWHPNNLRDGNYVLQIHVADKAGWETTVSRQIQIDRTPPSIVWQTPAEDDYLVAVSSVTGSVTDDNFSEYDISIAAGHDVTGEGFESLFISSKQPSGTLFQLNALPEDGNHSLKLAARDKAGNQRELVRNVVIDTTPPTAPVIETAEPSQQQDRVDIVWLKNPESDLAGYNLYRNRNKINTALLQDLAFSDTAVSSGDYVYEVTAIDKAGNESDFSDSVKVRIDSEIPQTFLSYPSANALLSGQVNIRGTAFSDSDFKEYRLYVGPSNSQLQLVKRSTLALQGEELAQWNTAGLDETVTYDIRLEAEDLTGNVGIFRVTVSIDNTAPNAPANLQALLNVNDIAASWDPITNDPSLTGYLLFRNGRLVNVSGIVFGDLKPYALSDTEYFDQDVPDGEYAYTVHAIDQAGNISESSNEVVVTIETHAPHADFMSVGNGSAFENSLYILAASDDQDIANVVISYRAEGSATWIALTDDSTEPYEVLWNTEALPYGAYELTAVATDSHGNTNSSQDAVPPTILTVYKQDLTSPASVQNFKGNTVGTEVTLTWTPSSEADLSHYDIYRQAAASDGEDWMLLAEEIPKGEGTYVDSVSVDDTYRYRIVARDSNGNPSEHVELQTVVFTPILDPVYTPTLADMVVLSGSTVAFAEITIAVQSSEGSVNLGPVSADAVGKYTVEMPLVPGANSLAITARHPDYASVSQTVNYQIIRAEAPSIPTGFVANTSDYDVSLSWNPNAPEEEVVGYKIYRNGTPLQAAAVPFTIDYATSDSMIDGNNYTDHYLWYIGEPLTFGWNQPKLISEITIDWNPWGEYSAKKYEIYAWDGVQDVLIKTVVNGESRYQDAVKLDAPYLTDRITLVVKSGNLDGVSITEVTVSESELIQSESYLDQPGDGVHAYTLSAVNRYGIESPVTDPVSAEVGDIEGPAPVTLTAAVAGQSVHLSWTSSTSNDISQYHVYRNGQLVGMRDISQSLELDQGPLLNGVYQYHVRGVDAVGNEGAISNVVTGVVSIEVLGAPILEVVEQTDNSGHLQLSWRSAPGTEPNRYEVYRSLTSGTGFVRVADSFSTDYLDLHAQNLKENFYHIRAVDAVGNQSAPSNERSAVADDVVEPVAPQFLAPVEGGSTLVINSASTAVSGISELDTSVYLMQNGILLPNSVQTRGKGAVLRHSGDIYASSRSATDTYVFMVEDNSTYSLYLYAAGSVRQIYTTSGYLRDYIWVNEKLLLVENYQAYVLDPETGQKNQLALGLDLESSYFTAYSSSQNRLFYFGWTNDDGYGLYSIDMATQEKRLVIAGDMSDFMGLSSDEKYYAVQLGSSVLAIVDLLSGNVRTIDFTDANGEQLYVSLGSMQPWIGSSHKVAIAKYQQSEVSIVIVDADSGSQEEFVIDDYGFGDYFVIGEGGSKVLYWSYLNDNQGALMLLDRETGSKEVLDSAPNGEFYPQFISADNELIYSRYTSSDSDFNVYSLGESFRFADVALQNGDNVISAIAVDRAGNVSDASAPITLKRMIDGGFDLAISSEISSPIVATGKPVRVDLVVTNTAGSKSSLSTLNVSVVGPNGELVALASDVAVPALEGMQSWQYGVNVQPASAGNYAVVATIDPENTGKEMSFGNNTTMQEFLVTPTGKPTVALSLEPSSAGASGVGAYEDVHMTATIVNPGVLFNGRIKLVLKSAAGREVQTVSESAVAKLPFGGSTTVKHTWNTGNMGSGSYTVESQLYNEAGTLIETKAAPLVIVPEINLISAITAAKSYYKPNEAVNMRATLVNSGGNTLFAGGEAHIHVKTQAGAVVAEKVIAVGQLLPGESTELRSSWDVANALPGRYVIQLVVVSNGQQVTTSIGNIDVLPSEPRFVGSLTLAESEYSKGESVATTFTVSSIGNIAVPGVTIRLEVVEVSSSAVINSTELLQAFDVGGSINLEAVFESSNYALGRYRLDLVTRALNGQDTLVQVLDSEFFTILDGEGPDVGFVSPASGAIVNSERVAPVISATDSESGVLRVEFAVDGEVWKQVLPNVLSAREYTATLTGVAEGGHSLKARAVDKLGNVSNTQVLDIVVDNQAPQVAVGGVINGRYYNSAVTIDINVTDEHLLSSSYKLNDQTFASGGTVSAEGEHILTIEAVDAANNVSRNIVLFGIDTTSASIEVTGVANNGIYQAPVTPVITIVEQNVAATSIRLDGAAYLSGTPVNAEGSHVLQIEVQDVAGNTASKTVSFELDFTAPVAVVITSHSNNGTVSEPSVNLQGTAEPNSIVGMSRSTGTALAIADASGNFIFNGVELTVGDNGFDFIATDRAGNPSTSTHFVLKRAQAASAEITVTPDLVNSHVLIWAPPQWHLHHPNCALWNHAGHGSFNFYAYDTEALLEVMAEALDEADKDYRIVRSEADFVRAMRSQRFNTFVLVDLTDLVSLPLFVSGETLLEIRANVAAGVGLGVITNDYNSFGVLRDLLGVALDNPLYDPKKLTLQNSAASIAGNWTLTDGRAIDMDLKGATKIGEVDYRCSLLFNTRCKEAAMTIDKYGSGDVSALAFNPASMGNTQNAKALMLKMVEFIRPDQAIRIPYGTSEITWFADRLSPPTNLVFEQMLDDEMAYVDAIDGTVESTTEASWNRSLTSTTNTRFTALVRTPAAPGNYPIRSTLFASGVQAAQQDFTFAATAGVDDLEQQTISYMENALAQSSWFNRLSYSIALGYVRFAVNCSRSNKLESELAIFKLLLAVHEMKLTNDENANRQIGYLLKAYERLWYEQ